MGAKAFTSQGHMVFGRGAWDKPTIAHEMRHLEHQEAGPVSGTDNGNGFSVSHKSDDFEKDAEASSVQAMRNEPVQRAMPGAASGATPRAEQAQEAGGPAIQRTVWKFNATTRTHNPLGQQDPGLWQNEQDPARTASSAQLNLGPHTPKHGDQYDDATQRLHSSGYARISPRGTVPNFPHRENRVRHALVEAKRRMASALDQLQAAGNNPTGNTLHALKLSFPGFQTASAGDIAQFLPRIIQVIQRVQTGLNAAGAEFPLVGETSMLDVGAAMATNANAVGWVAPTMGDLTSRLNPSYMKTEDLPGTDARSGPINLKPRGENAWFIIHEATHRFAGTLDYQYSSYDHEIGEDNADLGMAQHMGWTPDELAQHSGARLQNRVAGDPSQYTGQDEGAQPLKQRNWYAMGKRALMNADSYAQFVLTATGAQLPRLG